LKISNFNLTPLYLELVGDHIGIMPRSLASEY